MKTKKKNSADPQKTTPQNPPTPPNPEALEPESDESQRVALAYYRDAQGNILWDRMRGSSREALKEAFTNKKLLEGLGLSPLEPEKAAAEIAFGEDEANALLDLVQGISPIAASRFYKIPMEVTSQAFAFTSDHRKKLTPVYSRLMNKWGPLALKKWKDEIGAAVLTLAVLNSQVRVMHILEDKRKRMAAPAPAPAKVTPISEPKEKEVDLNASAADTISAS